MPRVGVVTSSLDKPILTGPGIYLNSMLNALHQIPNARDLVALVHYQSSSNPIYHELPELVIPRLPGLSELFLWRSELEVIHYNHLPTFRPLALVPAKKVLTLHGLGNFITPESFKYHMRFTRTYLWPFLIKKFDQVLTVSKFTRQLAIRRWNVSPDRIHVVYHGIAPQFCLQLDHCIADHRQTVSAPYLLHVSNYAPKKNGETLIRTFAEIKRRGFPHKLIIVGGRWEKSPVPELTRRLGLDDHVVFKSYIENSQLPLWYAAADLFVTLSLHESFCLPVPEAMACGCPVVVSNRGALPEIAGNAGKLIANPTSVEEVANTLCAVLEDKTVSDNMRAAGIQRASMFSWHKNAMMTLKFYQDLL